MLLLDCKYLPVDCQNSLEKVSGLIMEGTPDCFTRWKQKGSLALEHKLRFAAPLRLTTRAKVGVLSRVFLVLRKRFLFLLFGLLKSYSLPYQTLFETTFAKGHLPPWHATSCDFYMGRERLGRPIQRQENQEFVMR